MVREVAAGEWAGGAGVGKPPLDARGGRGGVKGSLRVLRAPNLDRPMSMQAPSTEGSTNRVRGSPDSVPLSMCTYSFLASPPGACAERSRISSRRDCGQRTRSGGECEFGGCRTARTAAAGS